MKKIYLILALSLFAFSSAYSQKTGLFSETITFQNESRTLTLFVPQNYDSTKTYNLLVGLHGAGDNSNNYANAIAQAFSDMLPGTIFVYPDGGNDAARDFYTPAGDEQIISKAIEYVDANYNVNTNHVILQGFSLGGRSALLYGLDHPDEILGLMLHTPAIQGVQDALNNPVFGTKFNYANASKMPMVITYGEQDYFYAFFVPAMFDTLIKNNAKAIMIPVPTMGHTIPLGEEFFQMSQAFIENPDTLGNFNVQMYKLNLDEYTCNASTTPKIQVRNLGSEDITSITFNYTINDKEMLFNWTGSIPSFGFKEIAMPAVNLRNDKNNYSISVSAINASNPQGEDFRDTLEGVIVYYGEVKDFGYSLDFESDSALAYVSIEESGDPLDWFIEGPGYKSDYAAIMMNLGIFYNLGMKTGLVLPVVNLTRIPEEQVELSFDLAYTFYRLTGSGGNQDFADTLEVLLSEDCGETFTSIFKKAGQELTVNGPITNPASLNDLIFEPNEEDWKKIRIPISSPDNAMIKFTSTSDGGSMMYIDNINIGIVTSAEENPIASNVKIYPNPAGEKTALYFNMNKGGDASIELYDAKGSFISSVYSGYLSGKETIDVLTSNLSAGVYMVNIRINGASSMLKLVKE